MDAKIWSTSAEPYSMLDALQDNPSWSDRKVRMFACWCARQVWDLLRDERSQHAVNVAERFAAGQATSQELASVEAVAADAYMEACQEHPDLWANAEAAGAAAATVLQDAAASASGAAAGMAAAKATLASDGPRGAAEAAAAAAEKLQADMLRDMLGNPFRE
jgi:hypothetical protein